MGEKATYVKDYRQRTSGTLIHAIHDTESRDVLLAIWMSPGGTWVALGPDWTPGLRSTRTVLIPELLQTYDTRKKPARRKAQ